MKGKTGSPHCIEKFKNWLTAGVIGMLEGFDRIRFRGSLRKLYQPSVFGAYLSAQHILMRDFKKWTVKTTTKLCSACEAIANAAGRPIHYIHNSNCDKQALAQSIAERDHIQEGLIALFKCLEPCKSYAIRRRLDGQGAEFRLGDRKCLHLYFYLQHPLFGLMSFRLQTWVPFQINVCVNGRHWLARQLDQEAIEYRKRNNAILWVADLPRAQALLDEQVRVNWTKELNELVRQYHPCAEELSGPFDDMNYYWSISESEYATDLIYEDPEQLARIYPSLVHHGISSFSSPDVMRFLGHHVPTTTGHVHRHFKGEIISDIKHRPEGVRVKHSLNGNSIKLYDKEGSLLRVETTINRCEDFKVYRKAEPHPLTKNPEKQWREMRRSVADTPRRAQISLAANHRYIDALGDTHNVIPLCEWTKDVCRPVIRDGKRYRAINPFAPGDKELLAAVVRGEFQINGFRNRDLQKLLCSKSALADPAQKKKIRARIGRLIRLLREHGLVAKVSFTHRYVLTEKGRVAITALLAAHSAAPEKLAEIAA
jgi:hypothetical protein